MADDDTVALQVRPETTQDVISPLAAYSNIANAQANSRLVGLKAQQQAATFGARQTYQDLVNSGAQPEDAITKSGLSAIDPAGAGQALSDIQQQRVLGANRNYDPSNPSSVAAAGPEAVGAASTALNTQATTAGTQADTQSKKMQQMGQIGQSFMAGDTSPQGINDNWNTHLQMAVSQGVISPLYAQQHYNQPNIGIARSWAALGAQSVGTSGIEAGNIEAAKAPYQFHVVAPGDTPYAGSAIAPGSTSGATQLQGQGRSVATGMPGSPSAVPLNPSDAMSSIRDSVAPSGQASPVSPIYQAAAQKVGATDVGGASYLARTNQLESGGNPNAYNANSKAAGPFQFIPSTWKQYAEPGTSPYDPVASANAAAQLAADNKVALENKLGRPISNGELYLAHQQGAGGAAQLLSNPNAKASDIVGMNAVIQNGGNKNMSAGQFANMWISKYNQPGGGNFSASGANAGGPGVGPLPPEMGGNPVATSPYGALPTRAAMGLPAAQPQPNLAPGLAAADAEAQGETGQPTPTPALAAPVVGRSAAAAPPMPPVPASQAQNPNGQPNPTGLVPLSGGMTPFALAKQQSDAHQATEQINSARNDFTSANQAQQTLQQLSDDFEKLQPTKDANGNLKSDLLTTPGTGAAQRIGLAKYANTALAAIGAPPMFPPDKIAAAESSQKLQGTLGFNMASSTSDGVAGYIVQKAIGLNPGIENTPQGQKLLLGSLNAAQQRKKDFYLFQNQYAQANGGNPLGAEIQFDQNNPPATYVQDAKNLARVPPQAVRTLQKLGPTQQNIDAFNQKYGPGLARYYLGSVTQ